jgi:hypothetical protein
MVIPSLTAQKQKQSEQSNQASKGGRAFAAFTTTACALRTAGGYRAIALACRPAADIELGQTLDTKEAVAAICCIGLKAIAATPTHAIEGDTD